MGDAITLVVNMNKKGFEKGCAELKGAIHSLSRSAKKMSGSMKKIIPSIIGVGSAYQVITKAVSAFMAQNEQLSGKMTSVWTALGNVIGPIVEQLIGWVTTAVSYLLSFLKLLGVTGKTASQLSKSAQKAGGDLKKTIAGFDELNVLQENSGGGGGDYGLSDVEPPDWMKNISDLLKSGQFAEAGRELAKQLNQMIEDIDWEGAGEKIAKRFKGTIDFLGNAVRDFDAANLGRKVASLCNKVLNIDSSQENTWKNLGELFAAKFTLVFDILAGFFEDLDYEALAKAASDWLIGLIDALTDSVASADWEKIGQGISDFLLAVDWSGVIESIAEGIGACAGALVMLLAGFFAKPVQEFGKWLKSNFGDLGSLTWSGFLEGLKKTIAGIGQWIITHIWEPFKEGVMKAFDMHSPSKAMEELGELVIEGFLEGMKNVYDSVLTWIDNLKQSVTSQFDGIKETMTSKISEAWQTIQTILSNIESFIGGLWGRIKGYFTQLGMNIGDAVGGALRGAVNTIISWIEGTVNNAISVINAVLGFLNSIPGVTVTGRINPINLPHLARGGILKKGEIGLLEGDGTEAVVPLEKNTEWIGKMADTFAQKLSSGEYDLSGNGKLMTALGGIADRVAYRAPAIAEGTVTPYSVNNSGGTTTSGLSDSEILAAIEGFSDKLDELIKLMREMQFVADFGDGVIALARKVTQLQRRDVIAGGR